MGFEYGEKRRAQCARYLSLLQGIPLQFLHRTCFAIKPHKLHVSACVYVCVYVCVCLGKTRGGKQYINANIILTI